MENENKEIENLEPIGQPVTTNFSNETPLSNENQSATIPVIHEQASQEKTGVLDNEQKNNISNEFVEKKSNNKKIIIIALLILLLILIVVGYKLYLSDSVVLFKSALNKGYQNISEMLDLAEKNGMEYDYNENITINGNASLESNLTELATYTGYDYNFNLGVNLTEQKLGLGLALFKDNTTVIDGVFYLLQNMLYIKSEKVYPQVLYSDMGMNMFASIDTEEMKTAYNYDDIDELTKKMTTYIGNAIEREKFVKEESTLNVNGEETEVVKHVYTLDKDSMYNVMTSILNQIKEDEDFAKLVAQILGGEENQIKESINEATVTKEEFENFETVKLNIYTTGFFSKFLGMGISTEDFIMTYIETKEQTELNISSTDVSINAITKGKETKGSIKSAGMEILTFALKLEEKEKSSKINLDLSIPLYMIDITANVESNKVSNKKTENLINLNLNMGSGQELSTLGVNLTYNMEIGGNIPTAPTESAVNVNELPETEQLQLMTNLENAVAGTPLEALFAEDDSYTDENYEYSDEYDNYTSMYRLDDLVDLLTPNTAQ